MLAYVFWHTNRADGALYEKRLAAFHEALAAHPPEGFHRSMVFSCAPLPWTPEDRDVYEDWYLIEDFTALGRLNEAAVSGPRQESHDAAAAGAEWGVGGLYRLHSGGENPEGARYVAWLSKPEGQRYPSFYAGLDPDMDVWRRQMVLGPAPEFSLRGSRPPHVREAVTRELNLVWSTRDV